MDAELASRAIYPQRFHQFIYSSPPSFPHPANLTNESAATPLPPSPPPHLYDPNPLWFQLNGYLSALLTLSLNLTLIALIRYRTPQSLKSYSTILFAHSVSDLLYEAVRVATNVRAIPLNGELYFLVGGLVRPQSDAEAHKQCLLYVWIALMVPIGLMTLDFVYRYMVICRNHLFSGKHVAGFVLLVYAASLAYSSMISIPGYECVRYGNLVSAEEEEYLLGVYDFRGQRPFFAVADIRDPKMALILAVVNVVILADYTTIIMITLRIFTKIKNGMAYDRSMQRLNLQVLVVMVTQTIAPSILLISTAVGVSCALFSFDKPSLYFICASLLVSWLRPLATILLIGHYRRAVFGWMVPMLESREVTHYGEWTRAKSQI